MSSEQMRSDAMTILRGAIGAQLPGSEVQKLLSQITFDESGRLIVIAAGKAAGDMADAAARVLRERISQGLVITKYGHAKAVPEGMELIEAGHPIPDENSVKAAKRALETVHGLSADDTVLFLLSGGASSLFEAPLLPLSELIDVNGQLLRSGADITEINAVRKRLSAVKGGRFARACSPARVINVILSDVLGNRADMVASGPCCPDSTSSRDALNTVEKYRLNLSDEALSLLTKPTVTRLDNSETHVIGSVEKLCESAAEICASLGYKPIVMTSSLTMEARDAGKMLARTAAENQDTKESLAFLWGGETVVRVTGSGKGGRNQELVLSACAGLAGLRDTLVFSVGSDGTDGPTDAAGGIADESTYMRLLEKGVDPAAALQSNDSYNALNALDALIFTGPTGTNVNDLSAVLIKR